MAEEPWYAERRARWKPAKVRLLLIGESPPSDGGDVRNRHFFYDDCLTGDDGLFRQVVHAAFGVAKLPSGPRGKPSWLQKLKDRGVYVIDIAPVPVNEADPILRKAIVRANVSACVAEALELNPTGIIVCKTTVFEVLADPLRMAGPPLLHDRPIPFPGSGWQKVFRDEYRVASANLV